MQFPLHSRSTTISARTSRESDADIFLISCLFRIGPHCLFIRDIMTGVSWVQNVGKLIERGRRANGRTSELNERTAPVIIRFHSVKLFQCRIYACTLDTLVIRQAGGSTWPKVEVTINVYENKSADSYFSRNIQIGMLILRNYYICIYYCFQIIIKNLKYTWNMCENMYKIFKCSKIKFLMKFFWYKRI